MGVKHPVTREQVWAACDQLYDEGHEVGAVSLKKILAITGGGRERVAQFINAWKPKVSQAPPAASVQSHAPRRPRGRPRGRPRHPPVPYRIAATHADRRPHELESVPAVVSPHRDPLEQHLRYLTALLESIAWSVYQGGLSQDAFFERIRHGTPHNGESARAPALE